MLDSLVSRRSAMLVFLVVFSLLFSGRVFGDEVEKEEDDRSFAMVITQTGRRGDLAGWTPDRTVRVRPLTRALRCVRIKKWSIVPAQHLTLSKNE